MKRLLVSRGLQSLIGSLCVLLPAWPSRAADLLPAADPPGQRPRIGLVLAGGGAKGGAHVGVIKVLEALRVPVDCIAGTSMGALIGGGYAAGMPAADLEKWARPVSSGGSWISSR